MKKYFIEFERMPNNEIIYMVFYAEDLKELEHDRDYSAEYATKFDLNYQAGFKPTGNIYEIEDENDYDDGISDLPEDATEIKINFCITPISLENKEKELETINFFEKFIENMKKEEEAQ